MDFNLTSVLEYLIQSQFQQEYCEKNYGNELEYVSFEYCHYWRDGVDGLIKEPNANACIINYENFSQGRRIKKLHDIFKIY